MIKSGSGRPAAQKLHIVVGFLVVGLSVGFNDVGICVGFDVVRSCVGLLVDGLCASVVGLVIG